MAVDIFLQIKQEIQTFVQGKNLEVLSKKQKFAFEQRIFNLLVEQEGKCTKCHRTTGLTLDHIVPSVMLSWFGVDTEREIIEENYQILCRPCNQFKSGRLDFSVAKTKEILLKLLERI